MHGITTKIKIVDRRHEIVLGVKTTVLQYMVG